MRNLERRPGHGTLDTDWRLKMLPSTPDTIAAIAGGFGGAVSIVRVSGPEAIAVADRVWKGQVCLADANVRTMLTGNVLDSTDSVIDRCLAVVFAAPHSYTGEDVVELHTHGGRMAPREVLRAVLEAGARPAEPGEFSKRAFVNGKMDLTQAEAVCDLIEAHSIMALHLANRQLNGALRRQVDHLYDGLVSVLAELESRMDFPEEELDWVPENELADRVNDARAAIEELLASRKEGEVLRDGVRVVIAGAPNVGKSSLLNRILGRDRAIVTEIPGTTRDTLEEPAHIRGIPVNLTDTAGLRDSADRVEQTGIDRTRNSLREAQLVLWVYDASDPSTPRQPDDGVSGIPTVPVANKADLLPENCPALPPGHIAVSCLTGAGLANLFDAVERIVWDCPHSVEPECAVSVRHGRLLDAALSELQGVPARIKGGDWELASLCLRSSAEDLGRITGRAASPEVLDHIFARFCIGK